jgi:hypothetical protein
MSQKQTDSPPTHQNYGKDNVAINSFAAIKAATEELIQNAERSIKLFTHDLDPRILSNRVIEIKLIQFIKKSRNSKLHILIYDENHLKGTDHRLIALAQQFTSYVEIRVVPKDFQEHRYAFYLVDDKTMLSRRYQDRYEADWLSLPDSTLKQKLTTFDMIWQQASQASFLRALHL